MGGYGDKTNRGSDKHPVKDLPPVNLGSDFKISQMAALDGHTCALSTYRGIIQLKCWGNSSIYQTGYGKISHPYANCLGCDSKHHKMGDYLPDVSLTVTAYPTSVPTVHPSDFCKFAFHHEWQCRGWWKVCGRFHLKSEILEIGCSVLFIAAPFLLILICIFCKIIRRNKVQNAKTSLCCCDRGQSVNSGAHNEEPLLINDNGNDPSVCPVIDAQEEGRRDDFEFEDPSTPKSVQNAVDQGVADEAFPEKVNLIEVDDEEEAEKEGDGQCQSVGNCIVENYEATTSSNSSSMESESEQSESENAEMCDEEEICD